MPQNLIQHIEWTTRDAQRLREFYGRIFDWKFREAMPNYTLIEGLGGIFDAPDPQMPIVVTPYVNVRDLEETEAKVMAAGGHIHKSRQEVPGMGWFTLFADPDGHVIGLWQAMPQPAARMPARKKAAKKTARKATAKKPATKKAATKKVAKKAVKKGVRGRR
jgi:predicted enzyme related to lactoylglutathione lyase